MGMAHLDNTHRMLYSRGTEMYWTSRCRDISNMTESHVTRVAPQFAGTVLAHIRYTTVSLKERELNASGDVRIVM